MLLGYKHHTHVKERSLYFEILMLFLSFISLSLFVLEMAPLGVHIIKCMAVQRFKDNFLLEVFCEVI